MPNYCAHLKLCIKLSTLNLTGCLAFELKISTQVTLALDNIHVKLGFLFVGKLKAQTGKTSNNFQTYCSQLAQTICH